MTSWTRAVACWRTRWGPDGRQPSGRPGAGLYDKVQSHADPPGGWRRTGPSGAAGRAALMTHPLRRRAAGRHPPEGGPLRPCPVRLRPDRGDEALYRGTGRSFSRCLWPLTPWPRSRPGRRPGRRKRPSPSPAFHPQRTEGRAGHAALKQVWERCKAEEKKLAGLLSVSEEEAMEDLTAVARPWWPCWS